MNPFSEPIFPKEVVKEISNLVGINEATDDVCNNLAKDVEYRLNEVIQLAVKFMLKSKTKTLKVDHINLAFQNLNIEPVFGYSCGPLKDFKSLSLPTLNSVQTQKFFYREEEELDLDELISQPLPSLNPELNYTSHWLAIEGIQPQTPFNPTPSKEELDPVNKKESKLEGSSGALNIEKMRKHELSKEQQLYFEHVTNRLSSKDKSKVAIALDWLERDTSLHQLLPYFIMFINNLVLNVEGSIFRINVVIDAIEAITKNNSVYIEPYIHQIIPAIMTFIVSDNMVDNTAGMNIEELEKSNSKDASSNKDKILKIELGLRRRSSFVMHKLCKKYYANHPTLKPRIISTLLEIFLVRNGSVNSHYGALFALCEYGCDTFVTLVMPNMKHFGTYLQENVTNEKTCVEMCIEIVLYYLDKYATENNFVDNKNEGDSNAVALNKSQIDDLFGVVYSNYILSHPNIKKISKLIKTVVKE